MKLQAVFLLATGSANARLQDALNGGQTGDVITSPKQEFSSSSWFSSSKSTTDKDGTVVTESKNSMDASFGPYDTQEKACKQCQNSLSSDLICMAIGKDASYIARGSSPDVVRSTGFVEQVKGNTVCECGANGECRDVDLKMLEAAVKEENTLAITDGKEEANPAAATTDLKMIEGGNQQVPAEKSESMGEIMRSESALMDAYPQEVILANQDLENLLEALQAEGAIVGDMSDDSMESQGLFEDFFGGRNMIMPISDGFMAMRMPTEPARTHLFDENNARGEQYSYSVSKSSVSDGKTTNEQVSVAGKFGPFEHEIEACDACFSKNTNPGSVGCLASLASPGQPSFAEFATPNVMLSVEFRDRASGMCGCVKEMGQTKCDTNLQTALNIAADRLGAITANGEGIVGSTSGPIVEEVRESVAAPPTAALEDADSDTLALENRRDTAF